MIEDAIDRAAEKSNLPEIRDRAAQCRLRTDWRHAQEDRKQHVHRMTHDNWVAEDNERNERNARQTSAKISASEQLLKSSDSGLRTQAAEALLGFAAHAAFTPRIREIFTASATNEARTALSRLSAVQAAAAKQMVDGIGNPAIIPRPFRSISR